MNAYENTARIVGILYIIGTVAGVLSVVFTGPVQDASDYLVAVPENETRLVIGALCVLTMGLALAMVPVMIFPISKKHHETLALGYVVFRGALETVTYMATVLGWLFLIKLGQVYVQPDAPDTSNFQAWGPLLLEAEAMSTVTTVVFILGALMFYYVLYRSKLVPRWISGWGLIAAVPYLAAGFFVMFGLVDHMSTVDAVLRMPLGIQEMVLAVWLIVKGFNPSAIAAGFAKGQAS